MVAFASYSFVRLTSGKVLVDNLNRGPSLVLRTVSERRALVAFVA